MSLCRSILLLMMGAAPLTGCGKSPPPPADAQAARAALTTSLDAWKNGESPESLKSKKPAIVVGDPDWKAGAKLMSYQIKENSQAQGGNLVVQVDLTVAKDGRTSQANAVYSIATSPKIVIIREEDGDGRD